MKKIMLLQLFFLLLSMISTNIVAAEDIYPFSSITNQKQFQLLIQQFRCLVCQNQTLADSNAPLANDLRLQIYKKIQKGESNKNIRQYLISRYGNYILYQPPLNLTTSGLWFGPFILLMVGLGYLLFYIVCAG